MLTSVAVLLPSRELHVMGVEVRSQYLLILAAMILWGVSEGYGCALYPGPHRSFNSGRAPPQTPSLP